MIMLYSCEIRSLLAEVNILRSVATVSQLNENEKDLPARERPFVDMTVILLALKSKFTARSSSVIEGLAVVSQSRGHTSNKVGIVN